jgi:mycothiol S-conjugate amidase
MSVYDIDTVWLNPAPRERTLLIAYAHPDDESFGNAGTVARYAAEGVAVHYACGTRGEVGEVTAEQLGDFPDIGALRSHELACASESLGMAAVHFLNYRDSGMTGSADNAHPQSLLQAPLAEVAGKLVALTRALRPQVVLTFGPYGGYGHPDHIKMHQATLAAFNAAGDAAQYPEQLLTGLAPWSPRKLYYSAFGNRRLMSFAITLMRLSGRDPRHMGTNRDIDFVESAAQATPVTTTLDTGAYADQKLHAWQCHASQFGNMNMIQRLPAPLRRQWMGNESFTRVVPPWDGARGTERDLFAGV